MKTPVLKKGCLAYYETLRGANIPVKILKVQERDTESGTTFEMENGCAAASTRYTVTFKVLEAWGGHDVGDVMEETSLHVFPKACLKRTKLGMGYIKPFAIEVTA